MKSNQHSREAKFVIAVAVTALVAWVALFTTAATNPNRYVRNKWSTNETGRAWHNFWVDAGAMCPGTNAPEAKLWTNTVTAADFVMDVWAFDDTDAEIVWFKLNMPDIWSGNGYFNMKVYATSESANDDIIWQIWAGSSSDCDDMPGSGGFGTHYYATNEICANANRLSISDGVDIGIAGSPVLGDLIIIGIECTHGAGTAMNSDGYLIGVSIQYRENESVWAEW